MTKRLFGVVKGHREHIADHTGRLYSDSEVADLLNTVYENCNMYREDALKAEKDKEKLLEENKQLKEQREKLFFRERDTKNRWRELKQENEQLKKQLEDCWFAHRTEMAHHRVIEKEQKEKNEQLKEQNADWETAFGNCKHYKEAYGTEIVKIKQTIKDMMENERTELGRSVLKQLWEAIQ